MIQIRKYRQNDVSQVALLISETFKKYNFKDNTIDAARDYVAFYNPSVNRSEIETRFNDSSQFFVAEIHGHIVGVLRSTGNRLVNLFVNGKFHRKGIGKKLIQRYENECKRLGYREIVLRAQLYAVPFYEACGYKRTTGPRNRHGLHIQPMKKKISDR